MEPLVVTTSSKTRHSSEAVDAAMRLAQRFDVPFVPCVKGVPIEALLKDARCVLSVRGDGLFLFDAKGSARWTAGMADLRIQRIDRGIDGQPDHVLLAGEVREGDAVLDCTLGRGHDALVMERAVGPAGRVTGIEASLPLYAWTAAGLEARGSRIEVVHGEALAVLRGLGSASFDCVFFDPMFSKLALYETGFALVRRNGVAGAVTAELVTEARRVARRWVVVKSTPQGGELQRLGLEVLPFKRSADLRFGRIGGNGVPSPLAGRGPG